MKNWILIIDSNNSILNGALANKEISYLCKGADSVLAGDNILGYIASPINESRMIFKAAKNGQQEWLTLEKHLDVFNGVQVNELVCDKIQEAISNGDYLVEITDEQYKDIVSEMISSVSQNNTSDSEGDCAESVDPTIDELAKILENMYNNPNRNSVAALYSFGLMYGDVIVRNNYKSKDIIAKANIKPSMDTELDKAKNLYRSISNEEYALKFSDKDTIYYGKTGAQKIVTNTKIERKFDLNRIVFGAPGTGKSFQINKDAKELLKGTKGTYERVTFHPEYSYSNFVGCYKPISSVDENGNPRIEYSYVPGPFMRVLVEAFKSGRSNNPQPHVLLVEEINRAKVAAVFGEVFQLLDRNENGESDYEIAASEEIKKYLSRPDVLGGVEADYAKLKIPNNMYIWATMNSADQGVFPMDTAFKRRWSFEYIGIDKHDDEVKSIIKIAGQTFDWNTIRKAINEKMSKLRVNEDKLLGPYFVSEQYFNLDENNDKANDNLVSVFKNKVLMYLFEDACKQKLQNMFEGCDYSRYSKVCDAFDEKGFEIFGKDFVTEYYEKV